MSRSRSSQEEQEAERVHSLFLLASELFEAAFIATAVPFDQEMKERVTRHREERGDQFHTIEEPIELPRVLTAFPSGTEVLVVDCLTVWLGNLYHHFQDAEEKVPGAGRRLSRSPGSSGLRSHPDHQ